MKITAEKLGVQAADLAISHNWKAARRAFSHSFWLKEHVKPLMDELMVLLYACGDFSFLFTGIHNESVMRRIRTTYAQKWRRFASKLCPSALAVYNEHLQSYISAFKNEGEGPHRYDEYVSRTVGRLYSKLSGCDMDDAREFATKTWSSTTIDIVNFVREMSEKREVV